MPQLDFLQAADFTFARIALRLCKPRFYQPAAQRDFYGRVLRDALRRVIYYPPHLRAVILFENI